jgi:hypothetical protein
MIKLKNIMSEITTTPSSPFHKKGILTNDPVKLYWATPHESAHVDIFKRVFPTEMGYLMNQLEDVGYHGEENDASYAAANELAKRKRIVRIVLEKGILYFNTDRNIPLEHKQLAYLKDFCIEHHFRFIQTYNGKEREIMLERSTLSEAFELPPEVDEQAEKLGKFIASLFLKYFKTRMTHIHGKSDTEIVKYNQYYRLAKQYRTEGKPLFGVMKDDEISEWGESSLRIYSKNDMLPDVLLFITNGYHRSNDGYMDSVEDPQQVFLLVNKDDFIKSFEKSTDELIDTVKHEVRHWYQATDVVGLPKTKILNKNVDVLGHALNPNFFGYVTQEKHHMRDIEFKTNLHTYEFHIKRYLNRNVPKPEWKKEFYDIVSGRTLYAGSAMMNTIVDNLEDMMKKDLPRWRQFVKELYKLIFPND